VPTEVLHKQHLKSVYESAAKQLLRHSINVVLFCQVHKCRLRFKNLYGGVKEIS
jgi:hypothetical protein